MPEYPIPSLAEKFFNIFSFNPTGHGITEIHQNRISEKGKQESHSYWKHQETTLKVWEAHLKGEQSIGQVPINYDSMVQWAAFDVDIYKNQINVKELIEVIETMDWPFIVLRSKSGGIHCYVFFSEPIRAVSVIEKMKDFTAFFGYGNCEVFPKQGYIGSGNNSVDFGNWLNMPYNGPMSLRYAMKKDESAHSASEFCDIVESKRISPEDFIALELPTAESEPFPDGPPCLNSIFTENLKGEGHRDTSLFNLAVYFSRVDDENVLEPLKEWNAKFEKPLPSKTVQTKARSASKKEYRYQCGNMCLKRFCRSSVCKTRQHGISSEDLDPTNDSLIQLKTEPELWYFTHQGVQVCVQRQELWNYDLLRQAFMAKGRIMLPAVKQEDWHLLLKGYLETCTVINVPPEATSRGQLISHIETWKKRATENSENLTSGNPYLDEHGHMYFRMADLKEYLRLKQFRELRDNQIVEVIQTSLEGVEKRIKAGNSTPRCWMIPKDKLDEAIQLEMTKPEPEQDNY